MASIPKDPYAKPVLIGSLVVLGAAVAVLVSNLFNTISRNSTVGAQDTSMFEAAATANLKPIGTVVTVDKSIAPVARTGEQVFNAVCTSCHTTGVLNAPKLDDKAAWEPRAAKGLQGLVSSATNGLNQMPAKGGDPTLTEQELTDAILYMTGKAGIDLSKDAGAAPAAGAAATPAPATAAPAATTPTAAPAAEATATPAVTTETATAETTATTTAAAPAETTAVTTATAPAADTAQQAAPTAGIDGEKIYRSICFSCHDVGIANSPKLGDKAAWAPRLAAGQETLYTHSLQGFNAMPAKGGNPALSDDEVKAAVDWMTSQAQ
ncbi:Cytochrome c5 [Thiothrix eikelboomii]|uniref:Cytochrome c5 n=1 Tax=Thiothrix eikelboomii TaxID=92487 RepID=A0A1T4WJN4_9GAMM|nr:c-type cytochrome [Thiothrix eikelboomii]SKA77387.1 Cytochrome c5 [Thiothrix eikelboomii]